MENWASPLLADFLVILLPESTDSLLVFCLTLCILESAPALDSFLLPQTQVKKSVIPPAAWTSGL